MSTPSMKLCLLSMPSHQIIPHSPFPLHLPLRSLLENPGTIAVGDIIHPSCCRYRTRRCVENASLRKLVLLRKFALSISWYATSDA